jgi:16S rRNA G966 N2-methylase RsmD
LYSNENDLVLEPFAGSGTTACAAMKLGRRFIAIEREKLYYDVACQRLEEIWQRKKTARRTTYITLPANQPNVEQTTPEAESIVPPVTESEHQHCEDTNLTENLLCHADFTEQAQ